MDFALVLQLYQSEVSASQNLFKFNFYILISISYIFFYSDLDLQARSYKSGLKGLQVLGFKKAKNIQRSFLMDGGSYIFKPLKVN